MDPRLKAGLLWGLVGALSFLVLVQALELVDELGISFFVKLVVAMGVFGGASVASYAVEERL